MSNGPVAVVDSVPGIVQTFYAVSIPMSADTQTRRKHPACSGLRLLHSYLEETLTRLTKPATVAETQVSVKIQAAEIL